jgi:hypothetical protein
MYNILICECWVEEGRKRTVDMELETDLSFVPYIGLKWENESKAIDLNIQDIKYSGYYNKFIITKYRSNLDSKEIDDMVAIRQEVGWTIKESLR